ncbi:RNAse M5 [Sinobaca qinghaiensis]|uniref:Ribonuclease M5 n=1 Tax=Sinobaca qinghaiensis TaxID=342944 RepID=A0A419VU33_9BACL|nr:ribonuclease M5 [Sinobaca qinghaiensis]RKD84165.1 RNAse M5 [Sinobaca qinghaiensis]
MLRIKECIVVEGKDDTAAVKRAVEADTIETNGSAIGESVLQRIELANERRGVIIFTDPDTPGERIRRIVSERVPGCKHAFITKTMAASKFKGSLGIEHASPEDIQAALSAVREDYGSSRPETDISHGDLIAAGLLAGPDAKRRREKMGEKLKIGYANGKQFQKRLVIFQIRKEEFAKAMKEVLEEEDRGV